MAKLYDPTKTQTEEVSLSVNLLMVDGAECSQIVKEFRENYPNLSSAATMLVTMTLMGNILNKPGTESPDGAVNRQILPFAMLVKMLESSNSLDLPNLPE